MSLIRLKTKHLLQMLTDLAHTAADTGHTAGVLLHTARGHAIPAEPGETDLLVGTSCTGLHIGHTWIAASGQSMPMLWPIDDVRNVIAVFKLLSKGEKDHQTDIRREGNEITVAEDPNLFGDTSLNFTAGDLDDYPRDRWKVLEGNRFTGERETPPSRRTDFAPAIVAAFNKVASRRKETIQMYRSHQRSPVLVQIGATYRGALMPSALWDHDNPNAGAEPDSELYAPDLPDPDEVA